MQSYDAKRLKSFIFQIQLPKVDCKHCKIFIVILDFFFVTAAPYISLQSFPVLFQPFSATCRTVELYAIKDSILSHAIYHLFTRSVTDLYSFCCQINCMYANGI